MVDAPVRLDALRDHVVDLRLVGDVAGYRQLRDALGEELLCRGFELVDGRMRVDDDAAALEAEALRDCFAEVAAAAGDQRHLAIDTHEVLLSLLRTPRLA